MAECKIPWWKEQTARTEAKRATEAERINETRKINAAARATGKKANKAIPLTKKKGKK